jgi:hypothetical protein
MRAIKKNDKLVALILDGEFLEGSQPITDEQWPLQVISLKHSKGKIWPAHIHKPLTRITDYLMEMLIVISGKIKVDLYHQKNLVESVVLGSGQGVMVVNGIIKMEALEDVKLLEFKNGPFKEDKEILTNL